MEQQRRQALHEVGDGNSLSHTSISPPGQTGQIGH
jgi:hypothetical protein